MNDVRSDPFLSHGFEPIRMECDYSHLIVEGEIPEEVDGTFYRIGPNPQFPPRGIYNPLNGDGMVHAFRIAGGRVSYRNRCVRTQRWKIERDAGRALFGTSGMPSDSDPIVLGKDSDGVANTNLVWHANRLLALEEGHGPIQLDPESLETIGQWSFEGKLPRNMTAHPKIDPETAEMFFFANFPTGRINGQVAVYVANAKGDLVASATIDGPFPALIHDFAITRDYIAVWFCPVTVSIKRAMAGKPAIAWEPELGIQIGLVERSNLSGEVRWFSGTPDMAWHSMNAFNDGPRISIDVCSQKVPVFPRADGSPNDPRSATQLLTRWNLDWNQPGRFSETTLSDERCEYPRIDERRIGSSYQHGYVACHGGPGSDDLFHRGLGHFDHASREMQTWSLGRSFAVAEPVFVPRSSDAEEGDGYLLTNIYDEGRNASHLAIFDAREIERGPIARAYLDHRVPVGFHAIWRPKD